MNAQERPELDEHDIRLGGVELHYRHGGAGPPLVLLHGFTLSGEQWDGVLSELTECFTVIIPDLPGHGRSGEFSKSLSFQRTAGAMLELLDRLDVDKVYAIGHSAGAITLLHMASKQPELIAAMMLVAGSHRISTHGRDLLRDETFESLDRESRKALEELHPGGTEQLEQIYDQMNRLADNYRDSALSPEELSTLSTHTMLVWGDRDPYFPAEFALEMYRALPNAELWMVPNQGHTPVWESLGGSAEAARMFPAIAKKFFDGASLS